MSRLRADSFVWDGSANDPAGMVGDNRNWTDAHNRDANGVSGLCFQTSGDGYDDLVTIPTGADVFINDGESAHTLPAIGQAKAVANSSTAEDAVSPSVRMSALSCGSAAGRVVTTKAS